MSWLDIAHRCGGSNQAHTTAKSGFALLRSLATGACADALPIGSGVRLGEFVDYAVQGPNSRAGEALVACTVSDLVDRVWWAFAKNNLSIHLLCDLAN